MCLLLCAGGAREDGRRLRRVGDGCAQHPRVHALPRSACQAHAEEQHLPASTGSKLTLPRQPMNQCRAASDERPC